MHATSSSDSSAAAGQALPAGAAPVALHGIEQAVAWLRAQGASDLHSDSRTLAAGSAFIAWPGAHGDGRAHLAAALARGAAACLVERQALECFALPAHARIATLPGLKAAAGPLADLWFAHPSAQLAVLAVTGTNGKTSTAWWLAQALNALSKREQQTCALIGTLGIGTGGTAEAGALTTPGPLELQRALRRFADSGFSACALEASSIGLDQARLAGTRIRTAIFTNFTQDHLDYHASMADYWRAKRSLFDWPGLRAAVVNIDDAAGARLHRELAQRELDLWSVSASGPARLCARSIVAQAPGLRCVVHEGAQQQALHTGLIGAYNLLNLLGVVAALRSLGIPLADALRACCELPAPPGRMQQIGGAGEPLAVVDYAHTPDALAKALQALRPLAAARGGRLLCLFGCGGERDRAKRPLMGAIAQQLADSVWLTSDNPRSEDPAEIIGQILQAMDSGGARVHTEPDRGAAIAQALAAAAAADVLLIAGKGHEAHQDCAGVRRPFSDAQQARAALQARAAGKAAV